MGVNKHIIIIELNALHTKRQNLFQELDTFIKMFLESECKKQGCEILFNSIVEKVAWKKNMVRFYTSGGREYEAKKALITVPLGVLRSGSIAFDPILLKKQEAIYDMGFGGVIKFI